MITENKTPNKKSYRSNFKSGLKSLVLFAIALSSGRALPLTNASSAKLDDDANPQSNNIPKECRTKLQEIEQFIGVFAKVGEKLGTLEVPVYEATNAIVARQSQGIHSCYEEVKNLHIQNGDVTFISDETVEKYSFDHGIDKIPLSPEIKGYAVFDRNKISDSDAKDIEALKKGELRSRKIHLLLSAEVPNIDRALYNLSNNPEVAHKESLELLFENLPSVTKEEKKALTELAQESLPKLKDNNKGMLIPSEQMISGNSNDDIWYLLKGDDELSATLKKIVTSVEPKLTMPSQQAVKAKLNNIPDNSIKDACKEATAEQYSILLDRSPGLAKKYEKTYKNILDACQNKEMIKIYLEDFNGAGQKMTKAGSVYIPYKFDKSLIDDLREIAKEKMSKTKHKNNHGDYAKKVLGERSDNGNHLEL